MHTFFSMSHQAKCKQHCAILDLIREKFGAKKITDSVG